MALSNKFLSSTCAPAHGDIATYLFFEKIFRSDGGLCVSKKRVYFLCPKKYSDGNHTFFWLLRRMALSNKFLSPTCAPAHGDIATYFFLKKIFRSDGGMCVSMTPFWTFGPLGGLRHWNTYSSIGSKYFFEKKICGDISMSRRICWWKDFAAKCHPTE